MPLIHTFVTERRIHIVAFLLLFQIENENLLNSVFTCTSCFACFGVTLIQHQSKTTSF